MSAPVGRPAGRPQPRRTRQILGSSELRWTVMVVALALAGVIALWPPAGTPAATSGTAAPLPQVLDP
jgi:hypothetical protein